MDFIRDTISVWWKELREMLSDTGVVIFFFLLPLAYPVVYYYVYSTETARDLPVAVVDESRTSLSRDFARKLDASPEAMVYAKCADMTEARHLMETGEVYGVVRIPSSFLDDLRHGRQTRIGVYCDASSLIYYKNILLPCTNISLEMNKDIKAEAIASNLTAREIEVAKTPIDYQHIQLYNPQGGYASFLIPPILLLILQQAMVLGVGMAMGRTRERNDGYSTWRGVRGYDDPMAVILGKTLAIMPTFLVMALYMHVVVTYGFDLPLLGDYWTWIGVILPYLLACTCFSIVCSSMIYRREDSLLIFVFMSVPLLFLSGVSWPSASIPTMWKWVSWLFPSTFGLNAHIKVMSMGADLTTVGHEVRCLLFQAVAYFVVACLLQRWQVWRSERYGTASRAIGRMKMGQDAPQAAGGKPEPQEA